MDAHHFDHLAKRLSSRRTALGGLLAGLLLPLEGSTRGKGKGSGNGNQRKRKGKDRGKGHQRASAQEEPCWRAGACIVSKGSNVSQCDLAGYTAPDSLDCTRCNLSRANLRGADLTGVNFTRANLSGACLVNADFSGATFANNTNLYNAIFCNTTMPDGSVNNSGCDSGTACCPTICLSAADCDSGERCCQGNCQPEASCCENSECASNQCESGTCLVEYALVPRFEFFETFLVDDDLRLERNGQVIFEDNNGFANRFASIPFLAKPGDALRVIGINGPAPNQCAYIDPLALLRTATGARQVLDADGLDRGCGQPTGVFYDRTFTISI
jgi:hypothetical protein